MMRQAQTTVQRVTLLRRTRAPGAAVFCLLLLFSSAAPAAQQVCAVAPGDVFPELVFQVPLTPQEKACLGIPGAAQPSTEALDGVSFSTTDLKAELLVVEFLNVHCLSCQAQTLVLNKVFELIQRDEHLQGRVAMLGICTGNTARETRRFKMNHGVPFPLIADPQFVYYETVINQCSTPLILMVRKHAQERVITGSTIGQVVSPLYFVQEIWDALQTDLNAVAHKARQKRPLKVIIEKPKPFITDEELEQRIRVIITERLGFRLKDIAEITAGGEGRLFVVKAAGAGGIEKTFFAQMISRNSVCDLCHAIHFIVTFDDKGIIADFDAVYITKYGNVPWTIAEIIQTRTKLVGKSVLEPIPFDPEVDAVSQATMSSALVFHSVQKAGRTLKTLPAAENTR